MDNRNGANGANGTHATPVLTLPDGMCVDEAPQVSKRLMFDGIVPQEDGILTIGDLGQGFRLVTEKKKNLSLEGAYKVLELPEFIQNDSAVDRNLRDHHVTYLMNCMMRGTFRPEWVTIITCILKEPLDKHPIDTEFRMNGQHTCWARAGMPAEWQCPVRFQVYEAATVADMRLLYASIDRNKARTSGDVLNAHLAGIEQFKGVPRKIVQCVASGLAFWLWGDEGRASTGHDSDDTAHQIQTTHKDLSGHITEYIMSAARKHQNHITRSPVMAGLFETFQACKTKAPEFWNIVRDGVGADNRSDPRFKLYEALNKANIVSNVGGASPASRRTSKKTVNREEMYRWCIHCWNSWRKGEEMQSLRAPLTGKCPKAK